MSDTQYVNVTLTADVDTGARPENENSVTLTLNLPSELTDAGFLEKIASARCAVTGFDIPMSALPICETRPTAKFPITEEVIEGVTPVPTRTKALDTALGVSVLPHPLNHGSLLKQDGGYWTNTEMILDNWWLNCWFTATNNWTSVTVNPHTTYYVANNRASGVTIASGSETAADIEYQNGAHPYYDYNQLLTDLSNAFTTTLIQNFNSSSINTRAIRNPLEPDTGKERVNLGPGIMVIPPRVALYQDDGGCITLKMSPGFCCRTTSTGTTDVLVHTGGIEDRSQYPSDSTRYAILINTILPYANDSVAIYGFCEGSGGWSGGDATYPFLPPTIPTEGMPKIGGIYLKTMTNNSRNFQAHDMTQSVAEWFKSSYGETHNIVTWVSRFYFVVSSEVMKLFPSLPWIPILGSQDIYNSTTHTYAHATASKQLPALRSTMTTPMSNYNSGTYYILDTNRAIMNCNLSQLNYAFRTLSEVGDPTAYDPNNPVRVEALNSTLQQIEYTFRFPGSNVTSINTISKILICPVDASPETLKSGVYKHEGGFENVLSVSQLTDSDKMVPSAHLIKNAGFREQDAVWCNFSRLDNFQFTLKYVTKSGEIKTYRKKDYENLSLQLTFQLKLI